MSELTESFNSVLKPTVLEISQAMTHVQSSQQELGKEIERLVAGKSQVILTNDVLTWYTELELFTDIAEPPKLQASLEKLVDAKKRLIASNKLMLKTTERVERIQKQFE
jgi:hypothetical protein